MNFKSICTILAIVTAIAGGQLLFKATALVWHSQRSLLSVAVLYRLVPAVAVYGVATLGWIWVLQRIPLQMAYPFMALTFVLVPIGGFFYFGERINFLYCLGVVLVIGGIVVTIFSR